ncbi:MAG: methylenetetrahydrofolate reductase [Rhodobacteraceae bacterium]|nr:methylenetetrahydrofolate reductase [Paracoccaceae bacterium]
MALLRFRKAERQVPGPAPLAAFRDGWSIEVMPRTAAKVADFRALLPAGTRVYVAHIEGTEAADMVATAARLRAEGFAPMPHIPARLIENRAALAGLVARYRGEAGVDQALVLAGGASRPAGAFESSLQLLETGLFDGFARIHVAGHPEGNRDIDPDGGEAGVMAALRWKQAFAERSDAAMAIATQFAFDAAPVIAWAGRLQAAGIALPIHVGIAGPAKLQTLLKFAIACGVGPSLDVLQRRARDVTRLVMPFEPTGVLDGLARHLARHPDSNIAAAHLFPLGGIEAAATYAAGHGGGSPARNEAE